MVLFVQLSFALNDPLLHVNLKSCLDILAKQPKEDPDQFYKEASKIKNHQIQDKNAAVDFYFLFAQHYYNNGNFDSIASSMKQAKWYVDPSNSGKLASVFLQLVTAFYFIENYDSLSFYQQKVADIINKKSPLFAHKLLVDGLGHLLSAKYIKSIESFIEAAKKLESQNDRAKPIIAYNNLAINCGKIQMYDMELEYLLKASEIKLKQALDLIESMKTKKEEKAPEGSFGK
jgi:tetratricopeptide (TPR) repeat protein